MALMPTVSGTNGSVPRPAVAGLPPLVRLAGVTYPPDECPYQTPEHPHGQVSNVGERFADGSPRLVRDIPVGTPAWKRAYHRGRNAAESRHSTFERWGCKRLPVYGNLRGKALTFQADIWLNRSAELTAKPDHHGPPGAGGHSGPWPLKLGE